jgi:hypothetical protein
MSAEEWRTIPGLEGLYEASSLGRIRSLDRSVDAGRPRRIAGRVLKPSLNPNGYPFVVPSKDGVAHSMAVHRLVALAFLGPRADGTEVCHHDGDKTNNAVANLRYDTRSANAMDRVRHGNHPFAAMTHCRKGHAYTDENTHRRSDGGRRCVKCERERALSRKKTDRINRRPVGAAAH